MKQDIDVGDIVRKASAGAITETKVKKREGQYIFIDFYEGPKMIFHKEKPVLIDSVVLISKATKPLFTMEDLKKWFDN